MLTKTIEELLKTAQKRGKRVAKPIELLKLVDCHLDVVDFGFWSDAPITPKTIILLKERVGCGLDAMFVVADEAGEEETYIAFGRWNDGIIE